MPSPPDSPHPRAEDPAVDLALNGSRLQRFVRGARLGIPILLGYVPVGAAFGVLARTLGFTTWQAVLCSATAIAGAGQFIALSLLGGGSTAAATIMATAVVNMRYVLFATTMAPHVAGVRLPVLGWLGFTLTDETFAVNISDRRQGLSTPASMAGVGAVSWLGWVGGTLLGAAGAGWIGDPSRWGVEFAMPAMFSALFVALAEDRRHVIIGIIAGALMLALPLLELVGIALSPSWFIIIASIVGAGVGAAVFGDD